MRRNYHFEDLHDAQYEELVNRLCVDMLGTGVVSFAPGRDGGRDGRFQGKAQKWPSAAEPHSGKFIIQAKWTSHPYASCGDREFEKIIEIELPKITKLYAAAELDHYLMFTNRRKPGEATTKLVNRIKAVGLASAEIFGSEEMVRWLDMTPSIWKSMNFPEHDAPFSVNPSDLAEVVNAFHTAITATTTSFDSANNFTHVSIKKKNKINGLSEEYDAYIRQNSLQHFAPIARFLQNPRNDVARDQYHDAADELKQKIITHRDRFERFDEVLAFVSDIVISGSPLLARKKRYVRSFLHYMYYNCDIGQHA